MTPGEQIIHDVIIRRKLHRDDFYGLSRQTHLVAARCDAAQQLLDAGFSFAAIGRLMKKHADTIRYYLKPENRNRRKKLMLDRHHAKKVMGQLDDDVALAVQEMAVALKISPARLMARWVAERVAA